MRIQITDRLSPVHRAYLTRQLADFNARKLATVGRNQDDPLAALLLDEAGQIVGGLIAVIHWNLLEIKVLWVGEGLRGRGHGSALLKAVEQEGLQRQCRQSVVDTFSFQAPDFYLRHGYEVFGVLKNCPPGQRRYYLRKDLP
jgi:ribosomal protein S18 acetylase RimI-like enzyme